MILSFLILQWKPFSGISLLSMPVWSDPSTSHYPPLSLQKPYSQPHIHQAVLHFYPCSTPSVQITKISSSTSFPSSLSRVPRDFLPCPHITYHLVLSEIKEHFLHSFIYEAMSSHITLLIDESLLGIRTLSNLVKSLDYIL